MLLVYLRKELFFPLYPPWLLYNVSALAFSVVFYAIFFLSPVFASLDTLYVCT